MSISSIFIGIAFILSLYFFWNLTRIRFYNEDFRQNRLYILIVAIFIAFIVWGISRNFV